MIKIIDLLVIIWYNVNINKHGVKMLSDNIIKQVCGLNDKQSITLIDLFIKQDYNLIQSTLSSLNIIIERDMYRFLYVKLCEHYMSLAVVK